MMYERDIITGELPDVLKFNDGTAVKTPEDWAKRRVEILDSVIETEYGGLPPKPEIFRVDQMGEGFGTDFDTYRITAGTKEHPYTFAMRIFFPPDLEENRGKKKYPVILTGDGCYIGCGTDVLREAASRGYAVAIFDRTELAPDMYNTSREVGIYTVYPEMHFSAISAWAWGYHRCVDAFEQIPEIDTHEIAISGHSRGGKTVLLAGATDERIKYVNPNCSGTHGCGCYRYIGYDNLFDGWGDKYGDKRSEPLCYLLGVVPYWLGPEMKKYAGRENEIPYDMHFVKALVAPRYLLETNGYDDGWANPRGSYLTHLAAKKVFRLLGVEDHTEAWYRTGGHHHELREFRALMDFIDTKNGKKVYNGDFITREPFPGLFNEELSFKK